jgi:hypothetical protein
MNLYKVNQIVLCQVATYRTIEATSMEEAMGKVAGIETATADCDYEILSDREVLSVAIKLERSLED